MCVQQVGSAVKRHNCLACSGSTLHHKNASLWRPNDFILFGLNGGNNVAQLSGSAATKRGEQCAVSAKSLARVITAESLVLPNTKMSFAKQLIFKCQQLWTFNNKMSTPQQAHWLTTRRTIKRFSNGCAPINNYWFTVCISYRKSTDVKTFYLVTRICCAINTPEHQCSIS